MAKREVPPAKTRRALAKVRRAVEKAKSGENDAELTRWEREFVDGLEERLEKYGSAFADLSKGGADEALSLRQAQKLREVAKKTRKPPARPNKRKGLKRAGGFGRKNKPYTPRVRDVDEDAPEPAPQRPNLRVIEGGGEGED